MRTIPGMTVVVPADDVEARAATRCAYATDGPFYLRFGRLAAPVINDPDTYEFELGRAVVMREGTDVSIVACGLWCPPRLRLQRSLPRRESPPRSSTCTPSSRSTRRHSSLPLPRPATW